MKQQVQFEKSWFKVKEVLLYISVPLLAYFHMKNATDINPYGYIVMIFGFFLFLTAKLSLIKKGIYFSVGCDNMSKKMIFFYSFGYVLMVVGYGVTFL